MKHVSDILEKFQRESIVPRINVYHHTKEHQDKKTTLNVMIKRQTSPRVTVGHVQSMSCQGSDICHKPTVEVVIQETERTTENILAAKPNDEVMILHPEVESTLIKVRITLSQFKNDT